MSRIKEPTWPASAGEDRVAHERQSLPVRRPRRHVDRSLTAIRVRDHSRRSTSYRHQSQQHVLVKRMIVRRYIRGKGEVHDPLAVGRKMREPVVEAVVRDLLLARAIGPHSPDL